MNFRGGLHSPPRLIGRSCARWRGIDRQQKRLSPNQRPFGGYWRPHDPYHARRRPDLTTHLFEVVGLQPTPWNGAPKSKSADRPGHGRAACRPGPRPPADPRRHARAAPSPLAAGSSAGVVGSSAGVLLAVGCLLERARSLRGRAAEACHRRQLHRREHSCARRRAMPLRLRGWSSHVLERVPMRDALSAAACAATPGADARHRSSWSPEGTSAPRAVRRRASPPAQPHTHIHTQPPLGPGLYPSANGRWAQVQARPARADPSGWARRTPGTAPARGGGHPRRSTKRRRVRGQRLRGLARPACGTLQLYHYSSRKYSGDNLHRLLSTRAKLDQYTRAKLDQYIRVNYLTSKTYQHRLSGAGSPRP